VRENGSEREGPGEGRGLVPGAPPIAVASAPPATDKSRCRRCKRSQRSESRKEWTWGFRGAGRVGFLFRREARIAVGSPSTKMNGQEHPVFFGPVSAQEGLARRPLRRPARWLSGLWPMWRANEAKQAGSAACSCYSAHQSVLGRGLRWTR
jgi:hypothetical protein